GNDGGASTDCAGTSFTGATRRASSLRGALSSRRTPPRPHASVLRAGRPDRLLLGEPQDPCLRRAPDGRACRFPCGSDIASTTPMYRGLMSDLDGLIAEA